MIERTLLRRALAVIMTATALGTTPAFAQDAAAPQTVTPPTVVPTVNQAPTPTPAPAPTTQSAPDQTTNDLVNRSAAAAAGSTPEENATDDTTAAPAQTARPARPAARPAPTRTRTLTRTTTRTTAPAAAAPAPTPTPSPTAAPSPTPSETPTPAAAATPAPEASATPPAAEPSPAPSATTTTTDTSESGIAGVPVWAWILGAVVILAILFGLFARRRRNNEEEYVEPVLAPRPPLPPAPPVAEPVGAVPPIAAQPADAPIPPLRPRPSGAPKPPVAPTPVAPEELADIPPPAIAEDATVAEPEAAAVEDLTSGAAPVADRPWLEFAMRPVRAGTNVDEALVEFELTVGNAGNLDAEDVRIATYMLPAGADAEIDRVLSTPPADAVVDPLTIAAGEGTRVDGTLALPRGDLNAATAGTSFMPVVVADVRYRCPDGGEGRTSAAFVVGGVAEEGGALEPFGLDQPLMRTDIQAELYREPVRA